MCEVETAMNFQEETTGERPWSSPYSQRCLHNSTQRRGHSLEWGNAHRGHAERAGTLFKDDQAGGQEK